mmetsp:Transcript_39144/g.80179  ORF Transcript_39144/g.80179 Transcript_39144/m.80179 type:complete len:240 (-) Transcript_39144:1782-2501(-)
MMMKRHCCLLFCASDGAVGRLHEVVAGAFSTHCLLRQRPARLEFSISTHHNGADTASTSYLSMTPLDTAAADTGKGTTLRIAKPLGIVVEEIDGTDSTKGVCIGRIREDSNAASFGTDLCVHDKIVAVNGALCAQESFEVVMDMIASSSGNYVELTLVRTQGRVAVRWPNGVCVAAPVGEYMGNVAIEARYPVPYSCRSGSCGSCEHMAKVDGKKERRYRPCSAKVPKGVATVEFFSQY